MTRHRLPRKPPRVVSFNDEKVIRGWAARETFRATAYQLELVGTCLINGWVEEVPSTLHVVPSWRITPAGHNMLCLLRKPKK